MRVEGWSLNGGPKAWPRPGTLRPGVGPWQASNIGGNSAKVIP